MPDDESLQVMINGRVVECRSIDDKMRLEPVGGILADRSTEGYRPEELDAMVATLQRYEQPDALKQLQELVAKARSGSS